MHSQMCSVAVIVVAMVSLLFKSHRSRYICHFKNICSIVSWWSSQQFAVEWERNSNWSNLQGSKYNVVTWVDKPLTSADRDWKCQVARQAAIITTPMTLADSSVPWLTVGGADNTTALLIWQGSWSASMALAVRTTLYAYGSEDSSNNLLQFY